MKKTIKIIATFIALIIANYNICFADMIEEPMIFGNGDLSEITALILPLIFLLGIILIIVEIVTYVYKKKKSEETNRITEIIYDTAISLALLGSLYILLYLFYYGGFLFGIPLFIGSIISIIARKKKQIKISNIICGLIIIFSIISFFFLMSMPFHQSTLDSVENLSSELEMQNFNAKFMQYEGDNVKSLKVNNMLKEIVDHNMAQDDETRQIEVYFSDNCNFKDSYGNTIQKLEETSTSVPKVEANCTYKVTCNISSKGEDEGLVQSISVECNEKE